MTKCLLIIVASTQKQNKFECFAGRFRKVWQIWMFPQPFIKTSVPFVQFLNHYEQLPVPLGDISRQQCCKWWDAQPHCARYSQLSDRNMPYSLLCVKVKALMWLGRFYALFLMLREEFLFCSPHFNFPICKMGIINYILHNRHGS